MLDMFVRVALYFGLKALGILTSSMYVCDYPHDLTSSKDRILVQESCLYVCMHGLFCLCGAVSAFVAWEVLKLSY